MMAEHGFQGAISDGGGRRGSGWILGPRTHAFIPLLSSWRSEAQPDRQTDSPWLPHLHRAWSGAGTCCGSRGWVKEGSLLPKFLSPLLEPPLSLLQGSGAREMCQAGTNPTPGTLAAPCVLTPLFWPQGCAEARAGNQSSFKQPYQKNNNNSQWDWVPDSSHCTQWGCPSASQGFSL